MDDRDERAGVKFKDADLIGIPLQIILGEKNLKEKLVEIKTRKTREVLKVTVDDVVANIL
jgi:prolyl-tRNA synthetase